MCVSKNKLGTLSFENYFYDYLSLYIHVHIEFKYLTYFSLSSFFLPKYPTHPFCYNFKST